MFANVNDERLQNLDEAMAAFSMLSAHEFILEVLLANFLAPLSAEHAGTVCEELSARWERAYGGTLTADPEVMARTAATLAASQALVERLARKALRRAADLRRMNRPATSNDLGAA